MHEVEDKAVLELNDSMVHEISAGVHKTISSVFGIKPLAQKHFLAVDHSVEGDISGVVSLTQSYVEGALIVTFPATTIFGILRNVYKRQFSEIDSSTRQGVAEITNMIFGVFKTNLGRHGFSFKMVIPSVLTKEPVSSSVTSELAQQGSGTTANHADGHSSGPVSIFMPGSSLIVPFETENGPFSVVMVLYPDENVRFRVA